jgi:hypothetical protein
LWCQASSAETDRWLLDQGVGLLEHVTLRIHWFENPKELRDAAGKSARGIRDADLNGFSVLKRNTQTGEYFCDVYVVRMTGTNVDKERTTTFGHEVLHCFGLKHE